MMCSISILTGHPLQGAPVNFYLTLKLGARAKLLDYT